MKPYMKHLIVKNVGPIKDVSIELKKFNVFIGPQSSGKSTVAKILSTCKWIEKEVFTTLNENAVENAEAFRKLVEGFHKMEGYFCEESFIKFETDVIVIQYSYNNFFAKRKENAVYNRQKICYIPSERNMVTLPELQGFEFRATNLRSFLFDWFIAREYYTVNNKTDILNLGVKYYYDNEQTTYKDRIEAVSGNKFIISLACASSGLQSIIPLQIMLQYYSDQYYNEFDSRTSFNMDIKMKRTSHALIDKLIINRMPNNGSDSDISLLNKFNNGLSSNNAEYKKWFHEYYDVFKRLSVPISTIYIIEEPEQNLFPDTQLDLIENMLTSCTSKREHGFTITTHSPYIVNFLNVLLLRYYKHVENKVVLNPEDLTVFSVQNGIFINQLQKNTETGQISIAVDDLTSAMQEMYNEYYELKNS